MNANVSNFFDQLCITIFANLVCYLVIIKNNLTDKSENSGEKDKGGFHLYLFPFDFPFNYIVN